MSGKEDAEGFVNSIEYVLWQQMFHGMVCQVWKLPRKSGQEVGALMVVQVVLFFSVFHDCPRCGHWL